MDKLVESVCNAYDEGFVAGSFGRDVIPPYGENTYQHHAFQYGFTKGVVSEEKKEARCKHKRGSVSSVCTY